MSKIGLKKRKKYYKKGINVIVQNKIKQHLGMALANGNMIIFNLFCTREYSVNG